MKSILHRVAAATVCLTLFGAAPALAQDADAARQHMEQGDWDAAAKAWAGVVEATPDNGQAWHLLGYSLHAGGHLEKAIEIHTKAAEFEDFAGIANYNLGCAWALLGHEGKAFEALAKSAALGFDVRGHMVDDSDLVSLQDDPRWAMLADGTDLGSVIVESQPAPPARGGGGGMMGRFGGGGQPDPQEVQQMVQFAAERFQGIAQRMAPGVEQRLQMVMGHAMQQAQEIAMEFQQHMAQDQDLMQVVGELAVMVDDAVSQSGQQLPPPVEAIIKGFAQQARQGQSQQAPPASSQPQAAMDAPVAAVASVSMSDAQSLQNSGDFAGAAHAFTALCKQQPDNPSAWFGRAYNLHMSGQLDEAIEAHKKAASFEQIRGISLYNLGCAYSLTGKVDAAFEALQAAHEAGFDLNEMLDSDSDLDNLRDDPRFEELAGAQNN